MSTADVKLFRRSGIRPQVRTSVADGTISLKASGMTAEHSAALIAHLAEACELSSGVVLFDVAGCRLGAGAIVSIVQNALQRSRRTRCHARVVTDDQAADRALIRAGMRPAARIPEQNRGTPRTPFRTHQ